MLNRTLSQYMFSLHTTYFSFQGQFYEQVGVAMGSPVSPIMANLYMEHFERTALRTATTPKLWLRYVDDTFVIQQEEHKQNFLEHISNVDPAITFSVENNQQDGAITFLDTIVKPQADNTVSLLFIGNPRTHTSTSNWTATIFKWPDTMSPAPLPKGLRLFALNQNS